MSSQNNNRLYATPTLRLDTVVGGQTWWPRLFKAREEYFGLSDLNTATIETFQDWLEVDYGVKLILDDAGAITDQYTVIDEQKFILFNLKYA
jgi:hypothetical protein